MGREYRQGRKEKLGKNVGCRALGILTAMMLGIGFTAAALPMEIQAQKSPKIVEKVIKGASEAVQNKLKDEPKAEKAQEAESKSSAQKNKSKTAKPEETTTADQTAKETAVPEKKPSKKEDYSIEQVDVNMPEVTVYGYGLQEASKGFLGTEELTFNGIENFSDTGEGVMYYVLLDISSSMPEEYFQAAKDSISQLYQRLGEKDDFKLITFGTEIEEKIEERVEASKLEQVLAGIDNLDDYTLLNEALDLVLELEQERENQEIRRSEILMFSDGADFSTASITDGELLPELEKMGISLYALCISSTDKENIDKFGRIARESGGEIRTYEPGNAVEKALEIINYIQSAKVLHFRAKSNKISMDLETFSLEAKGRNTPETKTVMSARYQEDTVVPFIEEAEEVEPGKIRITFSEPMQGAGDPKNYSLDNGKNKVAVDAVAEIKDAENTYLLNTSGNYPKGEYRIRCNENIVDDTQDRNEVEEEYTIRLQASGIHNLRVVALVLSIFATIAAIVAFILFLAGQKKKKANKEQPEGAAEDGESIVYAAQTGGTHHHVKIAEGSRKEFSLAISINGGKSEKLDFSMDTSFIVGRADSNELYFDDSRMSRQHFVLEWNGKVMTIKDLQSTNGTSLNGVMIIPEKARVLNPGDVIEAGSERMVISF